MILFSGVCDINHVKCDINHVKCDIIDISATFFPTFPTKTASKKIFLMQIITVIQFKYDIIVAHVFEIIPSSHYRG